MYYLRMNRTSRSILIMCDSLRRDLLTQAHAPNLFSLKKRACNFTNARGVFPSTTRTSSACIATGCLPARHGVLGNTVILNEPDGLRCRSVGDPLFRDHLLRATGRTLKMPTLAQRLARHAENGEHQHRGGALIMSNVSAGAAYFFDPDGYGEVYHRSGSYGPGRTPIIGDAALNIHSGRDGDNIMTERFFRRLLGTDAPVIATLWLSEPDHSGHGNALGSPAHLQGIANADRCVAQVLDAVQTLRARGENILLIAASDHGMETVQAQVPVNDLLVAAGLKDSRDSREVVLAPNGSAFVLGIATHAQERIPRIETWLREQEWCGAIFHGAALSELGLPVGDPCCAMAVTMGHRAQTNQHGVGGSSWIVEDPEDPKNYLGCGQHGGLGPNEQSPFLIIDGGGFPVGVQTAAPVSLIDFAPTMLRHLGLPADGMDGAALPFDPPQINCTELN
jgi:arylsulfatase A-like enzyme